ncbi:hypothetical protein GCM10009037_06910 [Halarchaeum grantii]|uniref:Uncharacterized protein n=1 Tax=Halarchaeum grantii TaxID=1193105 RepID=A0A830F771_9EURY|nr:hypothetical protein [Halarchaeum grantii]GGL25898.1 hypothetical protein GCM10009037_06910 [Halarchaeum grantii]
MIGPDTAQYHCNRCDRDFETFDNLLDHPGCGEASPDEDDDSGGDAPRLVADGGEEYEPEQATLRDGESRDDDVHARRNAEQLAMRDDGDDQMDADVVKLTQAQVDDLADDGVAWLTTDDRVLVLGREDRYPEVLEAVADGAGEDEVVLERIRDASGTEGRNDD